jgi:hypothetical protein
LVQNEDKILEFTPQTAPYEHLWDYLDTESIFFRNMTESRSLETPFRYTGESKDYYIEKAHYFDSAPKFNITFLALAYMLNTAFLNINTTLCLVSMNAYNYHKDIFVSTTLIFEQNSIGHVDVDYKICILNYLSEIFNLKSFNPSFAVFGALGFALLLFFYVVFNSISIYVDIRNTKLKYFSDFWNWIKMVKIILYVIAIVLRLILYFKTNFSLKYPEEDNKFLNTTEICKLNESVMMIEILMICLTLIYFLHYLDNYIVGPIFETVQNSMKNIGIFLFSYLITVTGWSLFCNYIYGIRILGKLNKYKIRIQNLYYCIF